MSPRPPDLRAGAPRAGSSHPRFRRGRGSPRGPRARLWRRVLLRRALAGLFAGVACWLLLGPYGVRAAPPTAPALVVLADLPLGHILGPDEIARRDLPREAVPAAALTDPAAVIGRPLAAAVTRGETLTDVRVRGGGGAALPSGTRAVHVPLADPAAAARLGPGDHVDLVAVADGAPVVTDAIVADVDRAAAGPFGASESARGVTVAVPTERVGPLTSAALGGRGGVHAALRSR